MKKTILFSFFALLSTIASAQTPTSGLVAYYPFNGNANDESVNSNDGTVNGATPTVDRFGNLNSAYEFNGTGDNVTIPTLALTNVTKYSVSGWFQKSSSSAGVEGTIFCGNNPLNVDGLRLAIGTTNQIAWGAEYTTGSVWSFSENENFADDSWHFFTVIYDGGSTAIDSSQLKVFIDNIEISKIEKSWGTKSSVVGPINNQNLPIILGSITGNLDSHFKGKLDDFKLYDRVLTDCEITSLYNENDSKLKVTVQDTLNIYLSSIITTVYKPSDAVTTVKVYPNPTAKEVTIEIDNYSNLSGVTIKVLNSLSNEVHSELVTSSTQSIDVSGWSAGVYFLHVINGGHTVDIRKIVVNN
jgi:hypothetical protein